MKFSDVYCCVLFTMCAIGFSFDLPVDMAKGSFWWVAYDIALVGACITYLAQKGSELLSKDK